VADDDISAEAESNEPTRRRSAQRGQIIARSKNVWLLRVLSEGVHPKVVSERLGHVNITTTLQTYAHVLPTMQQKAVEVLDRLIGQSESLDTPLDAERRA
jgi:integrase